MPQFEQNRCLMTCLLNVYVLKPDSGVWRRRLARGTNHNSEPLRSHIEQLHARPLSIVPSTSNATRPQWQLPLYFMHPPSSVAAIAFAELDGEAGRLAGQPFHAGRVAVRRCDLLRHAVAAKLDATAGGGAAERSRGVQILDRDLVDAAGTCDRKIRSFRAVPAADPRVRRRGGGIVSRASVSRDQYREEPSPHGRSLR